MSQVDLELILEELTDTLVAKGYTPDDQVRILTAWEEAIAEALLAHTRQDDLSGEVLQIRYRVDSTHLVAEIESPNGSAGRDCEYTSRWESPSLRSYKTWIRYSRKDHCATVCDCRVIR